MASLTPDTLKIFKSSDYADCVLMIEEFLEENKKFGNTETIDQATCAGLQDVLMHQINTLLKSQYDAKRKGETVPVNVRLIKRTIKILDRISPNSSYPFFGFAELLSPTNTHSSLETKLEILREFTRSANKHTQKLAVKILQYIFPMPDPIAPQNETLGELTSALMSTILTASDHPDEENKDEKVDLGLELVKSIFPTKDSPYNKRILDVFTRYATQHQNARNATFKKIKDYIELFPADAWADPALNQQLNALKELLRNPVVEKTDEDIQRPAKRARTYLWNNPHIERQYCNGAHPNGTFTFQKIPFAPNGNCGFEAAQWDRQIFASSLMSLVLSKRDLNDSSLRSLTQLRNSFCIEMREYYDTLYTESGLSPFPNNIMRCFHLRAYLQHTRANNPYHELVLKEIDTLIHLLCQDTNECARYIGKFSEDLWASDNSLVQFAHYNKINFAIWVKDSENDGRVKIHTYNNKQPAMNGDITADDAVHLIFDGKHYDRLEVIEKTITHNNSNNNSNNNASSSSSSSSRLS
jgi:hypothetical protein